LDLAQRGSATGQGRRVGRPVRRDPVPDLRQVPRWRRGRSATADRGGPRPPARPGRKLGRVFATTSRSEPVRTGHHRTLGNDPSSRVWAGQGAVFWLVNGWCPRQDSNLRSRLRRAVLYPLSYGGPATKEE